MVVSLGVFATLIEIVPIIGCLVVIACLALSLMILVIKKEASEKVLSMLLMSLTVCLLSIDFNAVAANRIRTISCIIVFVDIALTCRLSGKLTVFILGTTTIQELVVLFEASFRIGIYDVSTSAPYDERTIDCYCDEPPCADANRAACTFILVMAIFLLDFYFTRSFAESVTKENAKMESAIRTTHTIAICIAAFEIDEAMQVLRVEEGLPTELEETLRKILGNLNQYKPYLPRSCFDNVDDDSADQATLPSESDTLGCETELSKSKVLQADLSWCRATILIINVKDALSVLYESVLEYKNMHSTMTETALLVSGTYKGVVELFVGDRFHISFNAIKTNCTHAASALKTAVNLNVQLRNSLLADLEFNSAVASGRIVKGDLGSIIMRRFTEIGESVVAVNLIERFARSYDYFILCNSSTAEECMDLPLQLLNVTLSCCGDECFIFELNQSDQPSLIGNERVVAGEWMYHIKSNPYSKRNCAMQTYLRQSLIPVSERNKELICSLMTDTSNEETANDEMQVLLSSLLKDSTLRSPLSFCFN